MMLNSQATAQAADPMEVELPPILPLPPVVAVHQSLAERDFAELFANALRAVVQRSWKPPAAEDEELLTARLVSAFNGRGGLTATEMQRIQASIKAEPLNRALQSCYVAFVSEDPSKYDDHRSRSNWKQPSQLQAFKESCMEKAAARLRAENQKMGADAKQRDVASAIYDEIKSGEAMRSSAFDANLDTKGLPSDFHQGCFGNRLNIRLRHLAWRKQDASASFEKVGSELSGTKLRASVQLFVDDVPQGGEVLIRSRARQVFTDPAVIHHDSPDAIIEVASTAMEKYWKFDLSESSVCLSVGGGLFVSPTRTKLRVSVMKERRFGCFAFDVVATIDIPLLAVYEDILPLNDPERANNPTAGYHYVVRHYVDVTGVGATVELELSCMDSRHNAAAPRIDANPNLDLVSSADARMMSELWSNIWKFHHHSALLHLFEIFEELSDIEYELLDSYRDFYLLDDDFFHTCACIARVKYANIKDIQDLTEAHKALRILVDRPTFATVAAQSLFESSREPIRNRFLQYLCDLDMYAFPDSAAGTIGLARDILSAAGLPSDGIANAVRRVVQLDIATRVQHFDRVFTENSHLPQRAAAVYAFFNGELTAIGRSLKFLYRAKNEKVTAVCAHRIACQLEALVPFVSRFVAEATQQLVADPRNDPFGETFCVICSMQQRAVDCFEATRGVERLGPYTEQLIRTFGSFLTLWISICRPRLQFCVGQIVLEAKLEEVSDRCLYCEAPADAAHLFTEVIEFFWQAAACSPVDTVLNCLTPFCNLLGKLLSSFCEQFAAKVTAVELNDDDVAVALLKKFVGLASARQLQRICATIVADAVAPLDDFVAEAGQKATGIREPCVSILSNALERVDLIIDGAVADVAGATVSKFFRRQFNRAAAGNSQMAANVAGFFDMFNRLLRCSDVANSAPGVLRSSVGAYCLEVSLLDARAIRSGAVERMTAILEELERAMRQAVADISSELQVLVETLLSRKARAVLNFVTTTSRDELRAQIAAHGSNELGVWAANVLCLRAEGGDAGSRKIVNELGIRLSRQ